MLENTQKNIINLETERLKIVANYDLNQLKAIFTDEKTMEYYPQFLAYAQADFEKFLEILKSSGVYVYPFILKETNQVIGFITLNNVEEHCKRVEVGYFLLSNHWKKGYAREILTIVTNFLKEQQWHRIEATVYSGNEASEKVLQDCGYTFEGRLRDKYLINDKYHDDIVYSIINK